MTTRIRIEHDQDSESPREWDNLGTFYANHPRYTLGDKDAELPTLELLTDEQCETLARGIVGSTIPRSEWREHREYCAGYGMSIADTIRDFFSDPEEYPSEVWDALGQAAIILPVYLYDHGGITLNTGGFACPWDSGQVGIIWVSREKVRDEYGDDTPETIERVRGYLKGEIETLDLYARGNVFGFVIESDNPERDGDHDDSCWGFLIEWGDKDMGGMLDHLPEWAHGPARDALDDIGEWVDCPDAPAASDTVAC